MSDVIVGVAVLDRSEPLERLHVLCLCSSDSKKRHTSIPVYAKGAPRSLEHQWEYQVRGNLLHVEPSLNWVGVFHNAGQWDVEYREFNPNEYTCAADLFRALNSTTTLGEYGMEVPS